MFYHKSNIKDVPVELVEIHLAGKPFVDEANNVKFKNFVRYGVSNGSGVYSPFYRAESEDGKTELTFRLFGAYEVEITRVYEDSKTYSVTRQQMKPLGIVRKASSNGLFVEKAAYRIGVGAPLDIADEVESRNGKCKVLLITSDAVVLSDAKGKTILIRKNDEGAMDAHGIGFVELCESDNEF